MLFGEGARLSVKQLAVALLLILALGAGMGSAVLLDNDTIRFTSVGTSRIVTSRTHNLRGVIDRYSQNVQATISIRDGSGYEKHDELPLVNVGDHYVWTYHWYGYYNGGYQVTVRVYEANGRDAGQLLASSSVSLKVDFSNSGGDFDPDA